MKTKAFTLTELIIVVAIIALVSAFSFGVWRYGLVKAEFDGSVADVIGIFQEARGYAVKNMQIDDNSYDYYYVILEKPADIFIITIEGVTIDEVGSDIISSHEFESTNFDPGEWYVYYEAPYGDFAVEFVDDVGVPDDLGFTMSSTKGDMSQDIIVHDLSGIAEEE